MNTYQKLKAGIAQMTTRQERDFRRAVLGNNVPVGCRTLGECTARVAQAEYEARLPHIYVAHDFVSPTREIAAHLERGEQAGLDAADRERRRQVGLMETILNENNIAKGK